MCLYVFSDGANMAKDVNAAIIKLVEKWGKETVEQAQKIVVSWMESQRYVREIWS